MQYHDYAVLLAYLDDSLAVRTGDSLAEKFFLTSAQTFTTACCRYRDGVERNLRATGDQDSKFAAYLYNPCFWVAFGHADSVGLVLLDDLDPVVEVTSEVRCPVEQAVLGFCPRTESLGLDDVDKRGLVEVHTLFDDASIPTPTAGDPEDSDRYETRVYDPAKLAFQQENPLAYVTQIKAGALAVMGQGLLMQTAMFRAIARRISSTLEKLRANLNKEPVAKLMDRADVDSLRYSILDTQGATESTILIFCRNFSVAATVVGALRCLTLRDLYDEAPELLDLVRRDGLHGRVHAITAGSGAGANGAAGTDLPFADNHAFASTYSTPGGRVRHL